MSKGRKPPTTPPMPVSSRLRGRRNRRYRTQPPGGEVKVYRMNPDGSKGALVRTEKDHPTVVSRLEEAWTPPHLYG